MKYLLILSILFLQTYLLAQRQMPELPEDIKNLNGEAFVNKALEYSDSFFEKGMYGKAAFAAAEAYKEAARAGLEEKKAYALNKEAKAMMRNPRLKQQEKLIALQKFSESLELMQSLVINDPALLQENISYLEKAGRQVAKMDKMPEWEEFTFVVPDSTGKGEVIVQVPIPPQVHMDQTPGHTRPMQERKKLYAEKIIEMNLARVEQEMKNLKMMEMSQPPAPEQLEEMIAPELEKVMPVKKEEIEKMLAEEEKKISKMDPERAKEQLLVAEFKNRYDSLTHLRALDSINLEKNQMALRQKEAEIDQQQAQRSLLAVGSGSTLLVSLFLALGFIRQRKTNRLLSQKNGEIQKEKQRSEELLLNILPASVADELKQNGSAKARGYDNVTVLFSDFKNFSAIAEQLSPEQLVSELDYCFKAFDEITAKYQLEKIKTIGDAYMCAGGLPSPTPEHAVQVTKAALEMQEFLARWKAENQTKGEPFFEARIGIHTGPIVAGVVGVKKFAYDIWGDTVNIAARMEAGGEAGRVNISGSTHALVKHHFNCVYRGKIDAKNKGEVDMYFVEGGITPV